MRVLGDTWTYYDPQNASFNDYTVYQKNVSLTVAAGTFTCDVLTFNQQGTFNTDTIWWNNSVGWVKYSGVFLDYSLTAKNF